MILSRVFHLFYFHKTISISDSLVYSNLEGMYCSKGGMSRKGVFLLIFRTVLFLSEEKYFNVCVFFFSLEQFLWLKIFFTYIWGGVEKHTQTAILQNFKGWCSELLEVNWFMNLDTAFRMNTRDN